MQLELKESQATSKTKHVFHFLGNYTKSMIKSKFEKRDAVKRLKNSPFCLDWTVTEESWKKLQGVQLTRCIKLLSELSIQNRKSKFTVSQKNRKSKITTSQKIENRKSQPVKKSKIENRESKIENRKTKIENRTKILSQTASRLIFPEGEFVSLKCVFLKYS